MTKSKKAPILGSPLNALDVRPPFHHHFLIDLSKSRVSSLQALIGKRTDVTLYRGDCNEVLLNEVFPKVRFEHYERARCLLDPYGLHLDWEVLRRAGQMKTIDLFLNFPAMDMNMNALRKHPSAAEQQQLERMTAFWGDESWREAAYRPREADLFGNISLQKTPMEEVVGAFRTRLRKVAGFKHVAQPVPMRNKTNAVVYYLFFASQQPVANDIVTQIFDAHRR